MNVFFQSRELQDFRRLCTVAVFLLLPFLLIEILELCILPMDTFTFRIWEAALATPYRYPGAYYPDLYIKKKKEYGDFYRLGIKQAKTVEWYTDSYGWRNRPEIEKQNKYDAIVIGDSNMVGSFLDQKDTLAEVLARKSNKIVYSYAYGSDGISYFFNDPRPVLKTANLLIAESKAGYWMTNNHHLSDFHELPDGSLDIIDRSKEFEKLYAPTHPLFWEKLESRIKKHSLWHFLRASLLIDYVIPAKGTNEVFLGKSSGIQSDDTDNKANVFRPNNGIVNNIIVHSQNSESKPTIAMRATGKGGYWHTQQFVAATNESKVIVKFVAKNSIAFSKHRIWIFENDHYRPVGEIATTKHWQAFEIPIIVADPSAKLSLQIDQRDRWQWLSLRDLRILNTKTPSVPPAHPSKNLSLNTNTAPQKSLPAPLRMQEPFPRPKHLTPLDGSGSVLTVAESRYYFYQAVKAMHRRAKARNMDFIYFLMPDETSAFLLYPVVEVLRKEGIKVIAYQPDKQWGTGVDPHWYWQKADSHWTEAAVRLTADDIVRMWRDNINVNRAFSKNLMDHYNNDKTQALASPTA